MSERSLWKSIRSLANGLGVTFRTMFKKTVTIQYPHEQVPVSLNYRGPVRLVTEGEPAAHKCVACLACQRICPTKAIPILTVTKNELNKNVPVDFVIDDALCCYCGLCVEVCPTEALEHTRVADTAVPLQATLRRTILKDQRLMDDNDPITKREKQR
jgi:NADH-quinone oxidoreductase subunit I